jgi:hypothetical protein
MTKTSHPPDPNARVELVPATLEQAPILANLLELYAHDFSEFHPIELGADGRFGYPRLSSYWSERGRHPFLAKVDGKLAGLVLVSTGSGISGSKITGSETAWAVLCGPPVPAATSWNRTGASGMVAISRTVGSPRKGIK